MPEDPLDVFLSINPTECWLQDIMELPPELRTALARRVQELARNLERDYFYVKPFMLKLTPLSIADIRKILYLLTSLPRHAFTVHANYLILPVKKLSSTMCILTLSPS